MAVSNSLTQTAKKTALTAYLNQSAVRDQINGILGSKRGTPFITSLVASVQMTPALRDCTNSSLLSAALIGESLNLSPSAALGQYWIIPYVNKKAGVTEARFQMGAAGYRTLAMRSGQYTDIDFIVVREGEYKGRDKFTGKQKFEFIEDDDEREKLPIAGFLAYFELVNGFKKSVFWTLNKMLEHANRYSQAFNLETYRKIQNGEIPQSEMWKYSSPWYTDTVSMAEKTLIKHLLSKYGILSTDLITAVTSDDAVIREDGTPDYVEMEEVTVSTAKKEEPIMPPPVEKKPEQGGAPETPEEAAAIAGALFK
jgi:recombination protein RecT